MRLSSLVFLKKNPIRGKQLWAMFFEQTDSHSLKNRDTFEKKRPKFDIGWLWFNCGPTPFSPNKPHNKFEIHMLIER